MTETNSKKKFEKRYVFFALIAGGLIGGALSCWYFSIKQDETNATVAVLSSATKSGAMQNNLGQAAAQSILSADGLGLSMPAKSISATTYDQAMADARHRAGRTNPFFSLAQKIASGINLAKQHLTPPPAPVLIAQGPGVAKAYAADLPEEIRHAANQEISGEKMAEQIEPPSPPLDSDKLHLVAVIEDRALLRVNPKLVSEGNWPQHLLLGPGDKYDSISVLEISNDSVTLDEDGKKVVKTIAPIR